MRGKNTEDKGKQELKIEKITEKMQQDPIENEENKPHRAEIIEENEREQKRKKVSLTILISVFCVIAVLTIFAIVNKFNTNIYYNIYLNGRCFSNKTYEELEEHINDIKKRILNKKLDICRNGEIISTLEASDVDFVFDAEKTYENVATYARRGNVLLDNYSVLKAIFVKQLYDYEYSYSQEKLMIVANKIANLLSERVIDDFYSLDEEKLLLTITRGTSGLDVNKEALKNSIIEKMFSEAVEEKIELQVYTRAPSALDADIVASHIKKEAKNAYVNETNNTYISHVYGIDFDKAELEEVLNDESNKVEGKVITFKVKKVKPAVLLGDLKKDLFLDKLSTFSTKFSLYDYSRNNNIKVSTNYINGTIIMPGEVFSFNKTVGNCGLTSRGFTPAGIYSGDKVDIGIGGGVCQTSSTVYNAAILANLEIVERTAHGFSVSYVSGGRDATIYYPYLDLKFKNNRTYPIKMVTKYEEGKITISIYGTYEEKEYDIEIESVLLYYKTRGTKYEKTSSLYVGQQEVQQYGQDGYASIAYKITKYKGTVIKKEILSRDEYKPMNKIILVGTKEKVVSPYSE